MDDVPTGERKPTGPRAVGGQSLSVRKRSRDSQLLRHRDRAELADINDPLAPADCFHAPQRAPLVRRFPYSAMMNAPYASPQARSAARRRSIGFAGIIGAFGTAGAAGTAAAGLLSGDAAAVVIALGAACSGASAAVASLGPGSPQHLPVSSSSAAPWQPATRERLSVELSARLHPRHAVRGIILPMACVLALVAAWLLPESAFTYAEFPMTLQRCLVVVALGTPAVFASLLAHRANRAGNWWDGWRQRGSGLDAVIVYTAAAGIGTWTWRDFHPTWGVLAAATTMIALAAVAGLFEEDLTDHGLGPLWWTLIGALVTAGVALAIGLPGPITALGAVAGFAAVITPARIRENRQRWKPGVVEFAPLAASVVPAMAADWRWIFAGAAMFFASAFYTWRYRRTENDAIVPRHASEDDEDEMERLARVERQMGVMLAAMVGAGAMAGVVAMVANGFLVLP